MQAFVDFKPPTPFGDAPTFRFGREGLLFGFQLFDRSARGANVRRGSTAFASPTQMEGASIDLIAVHPVDDYGGNPFDDATNFLQTLKGNCSRCRSDRR